MGLLLVKERLKNGHSKTWKIDNHKQAYSWGRSSQADLVSINPVNPAFIGVIEFRDNAWKLNLFEKIQGVESLEVVLNGKTRLQFNDQEVEFEHVEQKENLLESLRKLNPVTDFNSAWQIAIATANGVILSTKIDRATVKMVLETPAGKVELQPTQNTDLETIKSDFYTIYRRVVHQEDLSHLKRFHVGSQMDRDSKRIALGGSALIALLVIAAILTPKQQKLPVQEYVAEVKAPVIMKLPKEAMKKKQELQRAPAAVPEQTVGEKQANAGASKNTSMFKTSDVSGRISKLLSKVSSQAARTANVVVTKNGVAAGAGPSGRALAALGNVERPGNNWGSGNKGDYGVSTVGGKNGKGTAGFGTLAGGSAGKAGVGLIEEETEVSGGLDRDIIAQYIKSQLGQILHCYERELPAKPDLFGKVAVRFTIGSSGAVEAQNIGDNTLKNATVEGCILNKVAKWKFPSPKGGTKVLVTYPFLFKSTN